MQELSVKETFIDIIQSRYFEGEYKRTYNNLTNNILNNFSDIINNFDTDKYGIIILITKHYTEYLIDNLDKVPQIIMSNYNVLSVLQQNTRYLRKVIPNPTECQELLISVLEGKIENDLPKKYYLDRFGMLDEEKDIFFDIPKLSTYTRQGHIEYWNGVNNLYNPIDDEPNIKISHSKLNDLWISKLPETEIFNKTRKVYYLDHIFGHINPKDLTKDISKLNLDNIVCYEEYNINITREPKSNNKSKHANRDTYIINHKHLWRICEPDTNIGKYNLCVADRNIFSGKTYLKYLSEK